MGTERTRRRRRTQVAPCDQRVKGAYKRTIDRRGLVTADEVATWDLRRSPVLEVEGLFGRTHALTYGELVDLASMDGDEVVVNLPDLLAACRLDVTANLLVAGGRCGRTVVVLIRDAVSAPGGRLILNNDPVPFSGGEAFPVRLTVPTWAAPDESLAIVWMRATTFLDFVR